MFPPIPLSEIKPSILRIVLQRNSRVTSSNVGLGAELSLDCVLVLVTVDEPSDGPHEVHLEDEHRDEDDGEPVEQSDAILHQAGG